MQNSNGMITHHLRKILSGADIAFQRAIDKVILEHQRLNLPLWIKRNGKLEAVSANELLKEKKGTNSL
jgi:hypothetical protein